MHSPGPPQSPLTGFCYNVTHNLTQIMLGGIVFCALIIPNMGNMSSTYAQHIVLCTLGYFVLMAQAILAFSPYGWATHLRYDHKKNVHAAMQIGGSILVIVGTIMRMANVNSNFNTGHGICGILAMVLTICTLIGGLLSVIFPKQMNSKIMKIAHACAGAATLILAFIAMIFAFDSYYRNSVGDGNANTAIVLTVFALIGVLLMGCIKNFNRVLNN